MQFSFLSQISPLILPISTSYYGCTNSLTLNIYYSIILAKGKKVKKNLTNLHSRLQNIQTRKTVQ